VGERVTFSVTPVGNASAIYSYVWKFWDDYGTATTSPSVSRTFNMGGDPASSSPILMVDCIPVTANGVAPTVITATMFVNNAPGIDDASVTANDGYFSYSSTLQVRAYDLENDQLTYEWWNGSTFIGSGITESANTVEVPWKGNGIERKITCNAYLNHLDTTITAACVITCKVMGAGGGVFTLDFDMRGQAAPPPTVGASAGIEGMFSDAANLSAQRVGNGQTIEFTVYAKDPANGGPAFNWSFTPANNWSMQPPDYPEQPPGVTKLLPDGGYQNVLTRDISAETVPNGVSKYAVAVCNVVFTTTGNVKRVNVVEIPVTLIANAEPDSVSITRKVNNVEVSGQGPVSRTGGGLEFAMTSQDLNGDAATVMWTFYQPFAPSTGLYWGPKVVIPLEYYETGQTIQGAVTVTDRLGAVIVQPLPATTVAD
jgi:hypothetical protein